MATYFAAGPGWAKASTGRPVAATAIGPCRRSAAEYAVANNDVVSSIFSAASAAAPSRSPRATAASPVRAPARRLPPRPDLDRRAPRPPCRIADPSPAADRCHVRPGQSARRTRSAVTVLVAGTARSVPAPRWRGTPRLGPAGSPDRWLSRPYTAASTGRCSDRTISGVVRDRLPR